jgi:hypothetical protein
LRSSPVLPFDRDSALMPSLFAVLMIGCSTHPKSWSAMPV